MDEYNLIDDPYFRFALYLLVVAIITLFVTLFRFEIKDRFKEIWKNWVGETTPKQRLDNKRRKKLSKYRMKKKIM